MSGWQITDFNIRPYPQRFTLGDYKSVSEKVQNLIDKRYIIFEAKNDEDIYTFLDYDDIYKFAIVESYPEVSGIIGSTIISALITKKEEFKMKYYIVNNHKTGRRIFTRPCTRGSFEITYMIDGETYRDMRCNPPENCLYNYLNDPTIDEIISVEVFDGEEWFYI